MADSDLLELERRAGGAGPHGDLHAAAGLELAIDDGAARSGAALRLAGHASFPFDLNRGGRVLLHELEREPRQLALDRALPQAHGVDGGLAPLLSASIPGRIARHADGHAPRHVGLGDGGISELPVRELAAQELLDVTFAGWNRRGSLFGPSVRGRQAQGQEHCNRSYAHARACTYGCRRINGA
jgi:hypothetical protein